MNRKTPSRKRGHARTEKETPSPLSTPRDLDRARKIVASTNAAARSLEAELVRFSTGDRTIDFNVDVTGETVWATQQQIADLFDVDQPAVSKHIKNIFDTKELADNGSTHSKMECVQTEGSRQVIREISHYSLDVILSVGYRVSSKAATAFRKWANEILRAYLTKGYALNRKRLVKDPAAADDLAAELRGIRSGEIHQFAKVRDFFKLASSDYDGSSKSCRAFYALLQDKFHFAACGMTACQLVLSRANYRDHNMGMTCVGDDKPLTIEDARVGKNYLSSKELHILHAVSEQFLLYVYSKALRGKIMTMLELAGKFDELLRVCGYEVFAGYGRDYQRPKADKHAAAEFARFMMRQKKQVA